MDAAAAFAVAEFLNIKEEIIKNSLTGFVGTWRRLEKKRSYQKKELSFTTTMLIIRQKFGQVWRPCGELYPHTNDIGVGVYRQKKLKISLFSSSPTFTAGPKALFNEFVTCLTSGQGFPFAYIFAREIRTPRYQAKKWLWLSRITREKRRLLRTLFLLRR